MYVRAIREGIEVLLVVVEQVKAARAANSDKGRKITGAEWRKILAQASAALLVGLTKVFAPVLDDDALASFRDDDDDDLVATV